MRTSTVLLLLAGCVASLVCCRPPDLNNEQTPVTTPLLLRNATIADAEAIANIVLTAFHDSPHWKYAYQYMDKYPEEHHNCMYEAAHEALQVPGVLAQLVLLPNVTHPHHLTPVAAALWVLPDAWRSETRDDRASLLLSGHVLAKCEHRDQNLTRATDFERQLAAGRAKHLDSVYARPHQMYLNTLATHPDYQRHGAGGALVDAGVTMGREAYGGEDIAATLIATEAGEPLYAHHGWKSIRNFTIRSLEVVEGKRDEWRFDIMALEL